MKTNANPIYTIMVCTKIDEMIYTKKNENGDIVSKKSGFPDFGDSRVIAFYHEKETAIEAVKANAGDMYETCYDYAIVEEVEPGLYSGSITRWVFKYNRDIKGYEPIDEPDILKHACSITIG